jgi:hypothetical protein
MNSGERPRHPPTFLPHVTRRDPARQLLWGMLIDLSCATPVPVSGTSRPAIYLPADVQKGTGTGGD